MCKSESDFYIKKKLTIEAHSESFDMSSVIMQPTID